MITQFAQGKRNRSTSYEQISELVHHFWDQHASLVCFYSQAPRFTIGMHEKIGGLAGMLTIRIGAGSSGVATPCLSVAHTGFLILREHACHATLLHLSYYGNGAPFCTR